MLGEQIGEEKGKVTARRVLSIDGGTKVEVSFQSNGKLLGVEHQSMVTYTAAVCGELLISPELAIRHTHHPASRFESFCDSRA